MSSPTNKNPDQTSYGSAWSRGSGLPWLIVTLVLVVVLGTALANRQGIYYWMRLRGYDAPPAIAKLADQDGMKSYTRHLFYLNRPQLVSDVKAFRQDCPENESTIVLGCYHPGEKGIYLYDVKDSQLAGVQQVTAAHEVLHAVYERLSASERSSLDRQLQAFYRNGLKDRRVKDEIKLYQKNEPHDVVNEMSCVFGTEVADLPKGLEAYYAKYFKDRSAVVAYGQQYQSEFTRRQEVIRQYDAQLDQLRVQIDADKADLDNKLSAINDQQARLNAYRKSGNTSAYNAGVPGYNRLVDQYNVEINSTKALVDRYNRIVQQRNAVARELADLAKSLDTRLTPESTR
jgi:hypothetical protein